MSTFAPDDFDPLEQRGAHGERPPGAHAGDGQKVREGDRHRFLVSMAGTLRARGLPREAIEATLREINHTMCEPPQDEEDVRRIAHDIGIKPAGEPEGKPGTSRADTKSAAAAPWPDPLDQAAFRGIAGDFVRLVEPHTEADPAALLADFLASFGSVIGRRAYFRAEADRHFGNLFVALVGVSSKGRKGTSHGHVVSLFGAVDPDWASGRVVSGLSSGEGLIWHVRDAIEKREPLRKKGKIIGYQTVIADPGVEDKRLYVYESELASTLRSVSRDGSTLSPVVRLAWDTGNLSTLTKNSPAKATGAHISILGHITKEELARYLDRTEIGNGFANRFLWLCLKRSKLLPEGGQLESENLTPLVQRLREAIAFARKDWDGEVLRDEQARELWIETYPTLSEARPGLLGAVTGRAEAQTMRLALLYALLDCSPWICRPHLEAALAVWRYALDSARFLFGDSLGDPDADEILRALREAPEGLTRTKIRDLFGRNRSGEQIDRALAALLEHGVVTKQIEDTTGQRGRPAERWHVVR